MRHGFSSEQAGVYNGVYCSVKADSVVSDHSPEYYLSEKASFWNQHRLTYQTSGKETYK